MTKSISLVGLMGSGKSTLSNLLSAKLGCSVMDTDDWIERHAGLPIHEIVSTIGWDYFRNLEREFCQKFNIESPLIIATGGGFVVREENFKWLTDWSTTVYLHISPEFALHRIDKSQQSRPLLDALTLNQRLALLEELYTERHPIYNRCNFTLNAELPQDEVLAQLVKIASET